MYAKSCVGKHVTGQAWENMYAKSCVGKHVIGVKNGKNLTTVTSVRICHLIISAKCKLSNVKEI